MTPLVSIYIHYTQLRFYNSMNDNHCHCCISGQSPHFLSPTLFSTSYLVLCCTFLTTQDCKMLICQSVVSGFCFWQLRADLTWLGQFRKVRDSCSAAHRLCEKMVITGLSSGLYCSLPPCFVLLGKRHRAIQTHIPATAPTELLLLSALREFVPKARRHLAILKY